MAKRGATRRKKQPEPEANIGHRLIGGGIVASIIGGVLMFGGGHPRDAEPRTEKPEPTVILAAPAPQYSLPSAPISRVEQSAFTAERGAQEDSPVMTETEEVEVAEASTIGPQDIETVQMAENTPAETRNDSVEVPADITTPVVSTRALANNSPLPRLVRRNEKTGSETWHVGEHDYTLDKSTVQAFEKHAKARNWPKEMFIAACARESACKVDAINPKTKACSLFQLMPTPETQTLWRLAYEYGAANGHPETRQLIARDDPRTAAEIKAKKKLVWDYHPKNEKAREQVMTLCKNADFSTGLFAQDKSREIGTYENWLGNREISLGELVVINNIGEKRMERFARQAWDDKKHQNEPGHKDMMARAFFGKAISDANPSLVKYPDIKEKYIGKDGKEHERIKEKGAEKTVRQSYNDVINNFGGWKSPSTVLSMNLENN